MAAALTEGFCDASGFQPVEEKTSTLHYLIDGETDWREMTKNVFLVGRLASNDIVLKAEQKASRIHAICSLMLDPELDEQLVILDFWSEFGTLIKNDEKRFSSNGDKRKVLIVDMDPAVKTTVVFGVHAVTFQVKKIQTESASNTQTESASTTQTESASSSTTSSTDNSASTREGLSKPAAQTSASLSSSSSS